MILAGTDGGKSISSEVCRLAIVDLGLTDNDPLAKLKRAMSHSFLAEAMIAKLQEWALTAAV